MQGQAGGGSKWSEGKDFYSITAQDGLCQRGKVVVKFHPCHVSVSMLNIQLRYDRKNNNNIYTHDKI